jgi:hypothetical protein
MACIKIVNWSINDCDFRCVLKSLVKAIFETLNDSNKSSSNLEARDSKLEKMDSDKVLKQ